jgi:hypothetical protein
MLDGPHFTSSRKAGFGVAALIMLAVAGCSANQTRLSEPIFPPAASAAIEPQPADSGLGMIKGAAVDGFNSVKVAASSGMGKIKSSFQAGDAKLREVATDLSGRLKPSVVADDSPGLRKTLIEPAADMTSARNNPEESAWCNSMRERAQADSTILRGPRVAGSYDDQGKAEISIGLHYSDFRKADLVELRAEAECRKFMAQKGLQKLVASSPQNLTSAGFRARADAIDAERMELARLRQNVVSSLSAGAINREKATALFMLIEQLRADGLSARSQAERRIDDHGRITTTARALGSQLLKAEHELDAIDSATRTADNMDVDVQAGYNEFMAGPPVGANSSSQGFGGRVSFSMKLGVINPRRFEHERLATQAKEQAIQLEDSGPIWQAEEMRRNQTRAIAALEESQSKIENAMTEARKLLATLSDVSQPEFDAARLNARYQLLKLRADKAAVAGSLAEIRSNLRHLSNG